MTAWSILAVAGHTHVRFIDNTIAGCLAWGAQRRLDGWQVGEVERWPGYGESFDGLITPVTVTVEKAA